MPRRGRNILKIAEFFGVGDLIARPMQGRKTEGVPELRAHRPAGEVECLETAER